MAAFTTAIASIIGAKKLKEELDKPADAAKRARNEAVRQTEVAREKAKKEGEDIQARSDASRRKLLTDIERNQTAVSPLSPISLGTQATIARKTLTGQ